MPPGRSRRDRDLHRSSRDPACQRASLEMSTALTSPDVDARSDIDRSEPPDSVRPWRRAREQVIIVLAIAACVIGSLWIIVAFVIQTERHAALEHAHSETF